MAKELRSFFPSVIHLTYLIDPAPMIDFALLPDSCVAEHSRASRAHLKGDRQMASEKVRVVAFDTVELDDGDWDGPHPQGEFLTYTSRHGIGRDATRK